MTNLYTIGFTGKSAEKFFELLKSSSAIRLIDVRLNNVSQLAGFSKKDDLQYFLKEILNWEYIHMPKFAPTEKLLSDYKSKKIDWKDYENIYLEHLITTNALKYLDKDKILNSVLLCSEHDPKHCHRRLLAEFIKKHLKEIDIIHLMN